jgi:hypothetical protein
MKVFVLCLEDGNETMGVFTTIDKVVEHILAAYANDEPNWDAFGPDKAGDMLEEFTSKGYYCCYYLREYTLDCTKWQNGEYRCPSMWGQD